MELQSLLSNFNSPKEGLEYLKDRTNNNVNWENLSKASEEIAKNQGGDKDSIALQIIGQYSQGENPLFNFEELKAPPAIQGKDLQKYDTNITSLEGIKNLGLDVIDTLGLTGFSENASKRRQDTMRYLQQSAKDNIPYDNLDEQSYWALSGMKGSAVSRHEYENLKKTQELISKTENDLTQDDKNFINKQLNPISHFFSDYTKEDFEEFKDKATQDLVNADVQSKLNFLNTIHQEKSITSILTGSDEKTKNDYLQAVQTIAKEAGFEGIAYDKKGDVFFYDHENFYKPNQDFFGNFLNILASNAGSIGGGITGAIVGAKNAKNPQQALIGSVVGAGIGSFIGASSDVLLTNARLNRENTLKEVLAHSLEEGTLSVVGDLAIMGGAMAVKNGLKILKDSNVAQKTSETFKNIVEYTPIIGLVSRFQDGNAKSALKLISNTIDETQQKALHDFGESFGGNIKFGSQDNFRAYENIKAKFGENHFITKGAKIINDAFMLKSQSQAQKTILQAIRADESGNLVAFLSEAANASPTLQNSLKSLLNQTTFNLKKQLQYLDLKPNEVKEIFDTFQKGTKTEYAQAIDEVLTKVYDDTYKVQIDPSKYNNFRIQLEQSGVLPQDSLRFLEFAQKNIYNQQGVSFTQLNNALKQINSYYKTATDPNFKDFTAKALENFLRDDIKQGIDSIFAQNKTLYKDAQSLFSSALSDYGKMKATLKLVDKIKLRDESISYEQAFKNLYEYVKGQGGELQNLTKLTQHLDKNSAQRVELSILYNLFNQNIKDFKDIQVFDSQAFFKNLESIKDHFNTQSAKDFIDIAKGFDTLFKNDVLIANAIRNATTDKISSSIATTIQGAVKFQLVRMMFENIVRLLPNIPFMSSLNEKVQGASLRFHIKSALMKNLDVQDFKISLSNKAKYNKEFNSQTKQALENIIGKIDKAQDEMLEVAQRNTKQAQNAKDLQEYQTLQKYGVESLQKLSQDDFNHFVDSVLSGDIEALKSAPNIVYIADLSAELAKELGLNNGKIFLRKNDLHHSRNERKGTYNQHLDKDEIKQLPKTITENKNIYVDKVHNNFFITKELNENEIAMFVANKDELGNYVIHIKRVLKSDLNKSEYSKVGSGIEPHIEHSTSITPPSHLGHLPPNAPKMQVHSQAIGERDTLSLKKSEPMHPDTPLENPDTILPQKTNDDINASIQKQASSNINSTLQNPSIEFALQEFPEFSKAELEEMLTKGIRGEAKTKEGITKQDIEYIKDNTRYRGEIANYRDEELGMYGDTFHLAKLQKIENVIDPTNWEASLKTLLDKALTLAKDKDTLQQAQDLMKSIHLNNPSFFTPLNPNYPKIKEIVNEYQDRLNTLITQSPQDIKFIDTKGKEHTLTKEVQEQWLKTFNLKSLDESYTPQLPQELQEAIGKEIKLTKGSLYKIIEKGREQYIPQIKETLEKPDFALRDTDNMLIIAKEIGDKQYFTSINLETKDYFISVSNAPKKENILKNKVENGAEVVYQSPNAKSIFYTDTLLQEGKSPTNKIDKEHSIIKQTTSQNIPQTIKDIIDSSPQKGRDMIILGEENFTPQVIEYAHKNNKKIAISKLNEAQAKQLGFKYPNDVRITIDSHAINHTLNGHGKDSKLVQQSGQKAVDYTDIAEYRNIVKNADESLGSKDDLGQDVILHFKQVNGHAVVVESIRKKGNELAFKSMYFENGSYKNSNAYKNAVDSQKANHSPAPYGYEPHADDSTPLKVNDGIIPQEQLTQLQTKIKEARQQIAESPNPDKEYLYHVLKPDEIIELEKQYFNQAMPQEYKELIQDFPSLYEQSLANKLKTYVKDTDTIQEVTTNLLNDFKDKSFKDTAKHAENLLFNTLRDKAQELGFKELDINEPSFKVAFGKFQARLKKGDIQDLSEHIAINSLRKDRLRIQEELNINPIKEFGTNYAEHYHSGESAIAKLLAERQGQVAGAFHKEGLGDIDLVWGDSKMGLAHILERRMQDFIEKGFSKAEAEQKTLEFVKSLPDIIENGNIDKRIARAFLETQDSKAVIALDFNDKDNKWILTAYNKDDALNPAYSHQVKHNTNTSSETRASGDKEIIPQNANTINILKDMQDKDINVKLDNKELQSEKQGSNSASLTKGETLPLNSKEDSSTKNTKYTIRELKTPSDEELKQITQAYTQDNELLKQRKEIIQSYSNKIEKTKSKKIKQRLEDERLEKLGQINRKIDDDYALFLRKNGVDTKAMLIKRGLEISERYAKPLFDLLEGFSDKELREYQVRYKNIDTYRDSYLEVGDKRFTEGKGLSISTLQDILLTKLNMSEYPKEIQYAYFDSPLFYHARWNKIETKPDSELIYSGGLSFDEMAMNRERKDLEYLFDIKPIKEFGTNYAEFYKDGKGAIQKLLSEAKDYETRKEAGSLTEDEVKQGAYKGQVAGAFHKEGLGDIDLVWGDSKMGLQKIITKHIDDFNDFAGETQQAKLANGLSEIVENGKVVNENGVNTIWYKRGDDYYLVGLSKGFNGIGENEWIITSYEKRDLTANQKDDINSKIQDSDTKALSPVSEFNELQSLNSTINSNSTTKDLIKEAKEQGLSQVQSNTNAQQLTLHDIQERLTARKKELEQQSKDLSTELKTQEKQANRVAPILKELLQKWRALNPLIIEWKERKEIRGKFGQFLGYEKKLSKRKPNLSNLEHIEKTLEAYKSYAKNNEDSAESVKKEISLLEDYVEKLKNKQNKQNIQNLIEHSQSKEQILSDERRKINTYHDLRQNFNKGHHTDLQILEGNNIPQEQHKQLLEFISQTRSYIESNFNINPLKEFGTNYAEFYKDGKGAIQKLLSEAKDYETRKEAGSLTEDEVKQGAYKGQVAGAFYKEGLGDIDLVWGDSKMGLQKIITKHIDDFNDFAGETQQTKLANGLSEIIENGKVVGENGVNTIIYAKDNNTYRVGLSKGFLDKGDNNWIITAYKVDRKSPHSDSLPSNEITKSDGTNLHSNDLNNPTTKGIIKQAKEQSLSVQETKEATQDSTQATQDLTHLKQKLENASDEEKGEIIKEAITEQNNKLLEEITKLQNVLEKKDFLPFEIDEKIKSLSTKSQFIGEDEESLKKVAISQLEFETKDKIKELQKILKDNKIGLGTLKEFLTKAKDPKIIENKTAYESVKATLKRLIEKNQKRVLKILDNAIQERKLTYYLNTKDGEERGRKLFYSFKPDTEQIELFEKIFPIAQKLGVEVKQAINNEFLSKEADGVYYTQGNSLRVKNNRIYQEKGKVFLHELIHSVTSRAMIAYESGKRELLSPNQIVAINNIQKLYKEVHKNHKELGFETFESFFTGHKGDYGLKNSHEFVAELSNPIFREKLKKVGVFEKLVDNILRLFVSAKEALLLKKNNAYDSLKKNLYEIIDNYKEDFTNSYEKESIKGVNLEQSKELESRFLNSTGELNIEALKNEATKLPKQLKEIEFIRSAKKDSKGYFVDTPIGRVDFKNILKTYRHLYENTYMQDRRELSGAFMETLKNPLFVVRQKYPLNSTALTQAKHSQITPSPSSHKKNTKSLNGEVKTKSIIHDSYVFYKPFVSENGLVSLASFAISQNGELLHKTFYDIKTISKLKKLIKGDDEDLLYFKNSKDLLNPQELKISLI